MGVKDVIQHLLHHLHQVGFSGLGVEEEMRGEDVGRLTLGLDKDGSIVQNDLDKFQLTD